MKRIYISGDTEDIPEMRALKDIDIAFVCMNLPYTMDINQAASAVLEFRPKIVYPLHDRRH
jgi:L-ascorbate metabolism protein UlaG (beta-lactamase superfamily)